MAKRQEDGVLDILVELPWWVSVCVAAFVFVLVRFAMPAFLGGGIFGPVLVREAPALSWFALVFLFPAPISALRSWRRRRLLDQQSGIESIRALSWREFEMLLGEALRRQGYGVQETPPGPDGGIDLVATKDSRTYLVQCKHWRERSVGVKVVREMLGLVTAHVAAGAIVVTSGSFTADARSFASGRPLRLIEGDELVAMVRSVQAAPTPVTASPQSASRGATKMCPTCGASMVVREARRGDNAGSKFWGCSSYPRCRHTEPLGG